MPKGGGRGKGPLGGGRVRDVRGPVTMGTSGSGREGLSGARGQREFRGHEGRPRRRWWSTAEEARTGAGESRGRGSLRDLRQGREGGREGTRRGESVSICRGPAGPVSGWTWGGDAGTGATEGNKGKRDSGFSLRLKSGRDRRIWVLLCSFAHRRSFQIRVESQSLGDF